jgi:hypothetical protein
MGARARPLQLLPPPGGIDVHVDTKQVVDEWISIKRVIAQAPTLTAMPLRRLWARMLSMFTAQFPLILRLVAIAMTLTAAVHL